jgi:tetratricopeptide (TPR) repeat protein
VVDVGASGLDSWSRNTEVGQYSSPGLAFLTILFSDIVGSTELRARYGDAQADVWHAEVHAITREGVERFRGSVVKGLGDGLMAMFRVPTEAVSAAIAIQQSIARRNWAAKVPLQVRIGISAGEVDVTDDDVFGYAVNEAARFCAVAQGEAILVGELAATSARRADAEFGTPVAVSITPSAPPSTAVPVVFVLGERPRIPLPGPLENATLGGRFVGRHSQLETLQTCWGRANDGKVQVGVLIGEPGLGKSSLLGQFAKEVASASAFVLYGRCDERTSAPYQPFADALNYFIQNCPPDDLQSLLGPSGSELDRLVPGLAERLGVAPSTRSPDPESERWRLQDAFVSTIRLLSSLEPVLLVVDDLHWAGATTIDLLERLLRVVAQDRIMIVMASRPWDRDRDSHFGQLLADRHRLIQPVTEIALEGLARQEVMELAVEWKHRSNFDGAQIDELWNITSGNPLFVSQLLRTTGDDEVVPRQLPQGVIDVIERQLERHTPATMEILRAGALIGLQFEVVVAEATAGLSRTSVLKSLDEASDAGVVVALEGTPLRYEFTHALVRRAIEDQLSPARRRDLHARIAAALEAVPAVNRDDRTLQLALHWFEAGDMGDPAKGVTAGCGAAALAISHFAISDAIDLLDRVDELAAYVDDPRSLAEAAVLRAEAECLGALPAARAQQLRASAVVTSLSDASLMARAALAHSRNYFSAYGTTDQERVVALSDALDVCPREDRATRALLLSRLANEMTFDDPGQRRFKLVDEALELAREIGDPATLANVLNHRQYVLGGPDFLEVRLREGREMQSIAVERNDLLLEMHACRLLCASATENADMELVDQSIARLRELNELVELPASRWELASVEASRAIVAGRLKEAAGLVKRAFDLGTAAGQSDAFVFAGAQLMHLNYLRGRLPSTMDTFLSLTPVEVTTPLVSWVARELHVSGRFEEARTWWERALAIGLEPQVDVGVNAGLVLTSWAYMAAVSERDDEVIAELQRRLTTYSGRLFNQLAPDQPGHHFLALLADAIGDTEGADRHFALALGQLHRIDAPVMAALTQVAWARSLAGRQEFDEARRLATSALAVATLAGATQIEDDALEIMGDQ